MEPQQPGRASQVTEQQQTEPVMRTRRKVQEARAEPSTAQDRVGQELKRAMLRAGLDPDAGGPRRDDRQLGG